VGVGAHQSVGDGEAASVILAHLDNPGEPLQVDLVADTHPGRYHAEALEGLLGPAQQGVALGVALVFALDVGVVGVSGAKGVDLDGVINDEVGGRQRVDPAGVAAGAFHGGSHRGEVDDGGNPGEVLEQDS
jgi:hypothetical protein